MEVWNLSGYQNSMIDELDRKIVRLLQVDLSLDSRPFALMAKELGISERELMDRIKALKVRGVIRRFGATLRHRKAGFRSNVMVAWSISDGRIDEAGKIFSGFPEVTHCYQRKRQNDWNYNLYTMVHADSREQCSLIAKRMAQSAGTDEYILLFTEKEFKKTSMEYF